MSDQKLNRREFFKRAAVLGAVAAGASGFLAACEKPNGQQQEGGGDQQQAGGEAADLNCEDTTGLSDAEIQTRNGLNYTDNSPKPEQVCDNCSQWVEPEQPGTCGGCNVVPGPIHPKGWCTAWVAAT